MTSPSDDQLVLIEAYKERDGVMDTVDPIPTWTWLVGNTPRRPGNICDVTITYHRYVATGIKDLDEQEKDIFELECQDCKHKIWRSYAG